MGQHRDYVNEDTSDLGQARSRTTMPQADESPDLDEKNSNGCAADPDPTINVTAADNVTSADEELTEPAVCTEENAVEASIPEPESEPLSGDLITLDNDDQHELPSLITTQAMVSHRLSIGDVVAGRYVIVDSLPGSGMGQIYKAIDRQRANFQMAASYVALKFAIAAPGEDRTATARIENEFRKLSRLHHSNIVRVFDIGVHNGAEFIVMEWLEGKSLLSMLEEQSSKRMALARARDVIQSVAAGLAHAHEKNIVHGDIKPSNIFITERDGIKIIDFGASSSIDDEESIQSWATEAYASAEVLSGKSATKSDDVYSLAVTAYLLLSGKRPFGTEDAVAAQREALQPDPLPADANDSWPIIEAALSFDAIRRPRDAEQFLMVFASEEEPDNVKALTYQGSDGRVGFLPYLAAASMLMLVVALWSTRPADSTLQVVEDTLAKANTALLHGSLVTPPDSSALHYYREVLALSPDNARALDGLDNVAGRLLERAGKALAADDFNGARQQLSQALRVRPAHPGIPLVTELMDRHATDLIVRADRLALRDPDGAEQLLQSAEQLIDWGDDEIAAVRTKMAEALIDAELEELFNGIDARVLAERLAVPRGDSAIDLLARARELRPDDRRILPAANRIISALLFQALFAISENKLDSAQSFIDAAKSLNVRHLAMARAEYELVKARNDAASRQLVAETEEPAGE